MWGGGPNWSSATATKVQGPPHPPIAAGALREARGGLIVPNLSGVVLVPGTGWEEAHPRRPKVMGKGVGRHGARGHGCHNPASTLTPSPQMARGVPAWSRQNTATTLTARGAEFYSPPRERAARHMHTYSRATYDVGVVRDTPRGHGRCQCGCKCCIANAGLSETATALQGMDRQHVSRQGIEAGGLNRTNAT